MRLDRLAQAAMNLSVATMAAWLLIGSTLTFGTVILRVAALFVPR